MSIINLIFTKEEIKHPERLSNCWKAHTQLCDFKIHALSFVSFCPHNNLSLSLRRSKFSLKYEWQAELSKKKNKKPKNQKELLWKVESNRAEASFMQTAVPQHLVTSPALSLVIERSQQNDTHLPCCPLGPTVQRGGDEQTVFSTPTSG